jgi:polyhydroxyalkanoate synthesis regulator phasin
VRGVLAPLNVVLLTRKHIEEVVDDAVLRGRMTRTDAQEMIQSLLSRGARATDDLLSDIERMLGTTGDALEDADGEKGTPVSPNLPIADYDELSAAQVQERLDGLTAAELRKLRDYEQRHANRKTVLDRIERRLR